MLFDRLVESILEEGVESNYLYHATNWEGIKGILETGYIKPAMGGQDATKAQTKYPTVSVTRDIDYALGRGKNFRAEGNDVILILDKQKVQQHYKIFKTSQNEPYQYDIDTREQFGPYRTQHNLNKFSKSKYAVQRQAKEAGTIGREQYNNYFASKSGEEFEEAIEVPKGKLPVVAVPGGDRPVKGLLIGYYVNHKTDDPEIMNNPLRLLMPRPNQFIKPTGTIRNGEAIMYKEALDDYLSKEKIEKDIYNGLRSIIDLDNNDIEFSHEEQRMVGPLYMFSLAYDINYKGEVFTVAFYTWQKKENGDYAIFDNRTNHPINFSMAVFHKDKPILKIGSREEPIPLKQVNLSALIVKLRDKIEDLFHKV